MATNNLKENNLSDFSIDHILNRAGQKLSNNDNKLDHLSINSEISSGDENCEEFIQKCYRVDSERFIDIPNFDWLNYTRYNMPRIASKKPPTKRTPGRLPRIPFSVEQLDQLEKAYKKANYLSTEEANSLAKSLELTGVRVKIWFQNRRARDRREKKDLLLQNQNSSSMKIVDSDDLSSDENDNELIEII